MFGGPLVQIAATYSDSRNFQQHVVIADLRDRYFA
jgi:hypothetical protein